MRRVHRPDVEHCVPIELRHSFTRQLCPFLPRDHGLQEQFLGRLIDSRIVQIKIGRDPFKRASAVEHHRAKPRGMRARAHDRYVALMPCAFEKGPCFRKADRCCRLRHHCHPRRGFQNGPRESGSTIAGIDKDFVADLRRAKCYRFRLYSIQILINWPTSIRVISSIYWRIIAALPPPHYKTEGGEKTHVKCVPPTRSRLCAAKPSQFMLATTPIR